MIIRGTTPTHTFTVPIEASACDELRVIYSQNDKPIIKIETDRFTIEEGGMEISCTLTQEETLRLDCTKHCDVQVRILTSEGVAMASVPQRINIGRCLDNEVLE